MSFMCAGCFSHAKLKLREGKVHLSQWSIFGLDFVEMPTEVLAFREKMQSSFSIKKKCSLQVWLIFEPSALSPEFKHLLEFRMLKSI